MKNKKVLLIEDNADDIALTQRAFKKNNFDYELLVFNDGSKALNFLLAKGEFKSRSASELPDLILLDLKMPHIGGLTILEGIRAYSKTRYIPVVVLTTSQEENDIINSYRLGANSYIRKPVDFNVFLEMIKNVGNYWLYLNETVERN